MYQRALAVREKTLGPEYSDAAIIRSTLFLGPMTAKLCKMAKVQKRLSDQRVQLLRRGRGRGTFDSSPFGQRCGQHQNPAVFLDRSRSLLTEGAFRKQLPRLTQRP